MTPEPFPKLAGHSPLGGIVCEGRYMIFEAGVECGGEVWRIEPRDDGYVATGEQLTERPHPFPSRQEWRATLSPMWRVTSLEIHWFVGERHVFARHESAGDLWRARIDYSGHAREQEGDYPTFCEIGFGSPLFYTFALRHYVVAPGAEHEYPALFIGPPYMAVEPGREKLRCTEAAEHPSPRGPVAARRVVSSRPPATESDGSAFWIDEHDIVLEAFDGLDTTRPWMRLVEYRRAG